MKVLVSAASKYGATSEIAKAVADVLAEKGLEVTVVPPEQAGGIEEFDAVVLGSAVYMGQWMKPARELAERSAGALATRPVWLFSSGPVGEPARPAENPVDVSKVLQATKARDHQIFTGKLVKKHLNFPTGLWPQPSAPKRATSATGPRSEPGQPPSPTPCFLDPAPEGLVRINWLPPRYQARPAASRGSHLSAS
jgi:menaquinone-dependent protoporphyrinogen oxidase